MEFLQRLLLLFAFVLSSWTLSAQDLHRTLFNMTPLNINPAYTGDFEGTFRVGGLYKQEHSGVYSTPSFFVDVPIIMVRKRDWVSAGVSLDADKAGTGDLSTTRSLISASYHLSLDKKAQNYLVAGFQFGGDKVKLNDANSLITPDGKPLDATNFSDVTNRITNIGLMYRGVVDKKTDFNIGAAFNYVIRQEGSIRSGAGGGIRKRPSKIIFHGLLNRQVSDKLSLHPSFIVRNRGNEGTEVFVQAMAGYLFKEEIDLRLKGGIGYDLDEGPAVLLGADYGDWKFRMSFDIPVYGVKEAAGFGGFEIAASKIIKMYKKPVVEPSICCPDL